MHFRCEISVDEKFIEKNDMFMKNKLWKILKRNILG
jgi:hypothetical protein